MNSLPDGYKAYVTHFRRFRGRMEFLTRFDAMNEGIEEPPMPSGGATEATIVDPEGNIVAADYALCSYRDNYNKKLGRNIAIGRALKNMSIPSKV